MSGLAARVRWNVPDEVLTARGHMLLRVELDEGPYIADAGFGGLTLTAPLRLAPGQVQPTPHEPFRLIEHGAGYAMEAQLGDEWRTLYTFELQEQHQVDYEVSNWYLATNPRSHFLSSLIAARPDADRRYALRNNQLSVHHRDGRSERRTLTSVDELCEVLERDFRLRLPEDSVLGEAPEERLERRIEDILKDGVPVTLPQEVFDALIARRREQQRQGNWVERHHFPRRRRTQ